nr:MAG: hypothetical protein BECKDK2373C_GA0170839_100428 [Candidatus Kentron sp. DK]
MTCLWHKSALFSPGIHRIPFLAEMLGEGTMPVYRPHSPKGIDAVLGWGVKSTAKRAGRFSARTENLSATIYVKTHPEVSARRKRGYLSQRYGRMGEPWRRKGQVRNRCSSSSAIVRMTRPVRIEFEGALYHVTSRGDGREVIHGRGGFR